MLLIFILIIISIRPPHSFILPFSANLPTVAFLFFFRTDYMDSPDCISIFLSISVFCFLVFLFSTF